MSSGLSHSTKPIGSTRPEAQRAGPNSRSVGFGSYARKNLKFGSGGGLCNLKLVEIYPTDNKLKKDLGLFSHSKSRLDLSLSLKVQIFVFHALSLCLSQIPTLRLCLNATASPIATSPPYWVVSRLKPHSLEVKNNRKLERERKGKT